VPLPLTQTIKIDDAYAMKYRVQLRMSLNRDKGSKVRNKIKGRLTKEGITQRFVISEKSGQSTGTWEGTRLDARAITAVREVLEILEGLPDSVTNANAEVTLDHVWLYIDQD
jgi:hypothetical protein